MRTRYQLLSDSVAAACSSQKEQLVSSTRLRLARPVAIRLLRNSRTMLERRITRFAQRKYLCKRTSIRFHWTRQLRLLSNAQAATLDDNTWGETDGASITINDATPMTWERLVCTLVHEALHNVAHVRGKCISCDNEHALMRGLGL